MDPTDPYLTRLTVQLLDGVEKLPAEVRERHAGYVRRKQRPDGGWPGREGGSDLYYTGFALRSLAVLQALTPDVCERAGAFLRSRMTASAGVVDFFSLVVGCYLVPVGGGPDVLADAPAGWKDRTDALLETFRTPDGGYGKAPGAASGSTYTSFLVTLCRELLGRPVPDVPALVRFVRSRARDDGGFVEIAPMRRSGTNPTAAGVGVLQIADALAADERSRVVAFLGELLSPSEGGYRANGRIPAADLLSTFTASWTLVQLGAIDRVDTAAVREYAEGCEVPTGGFRGGLWDEADDVEYTFYGLGTLALTADASARKGLFEP